MILKQCSKTFVQLISFVYGSLLIHYLNAPKIKILVFFTLKCNNKLSISLFLDINQLTIAKRDNFSLLKIIERIPELRFKYMGSYPFDKVPQLTNFSYTIITSAPSNDRGEHWIMNARHDKSYYFADSLAYTFSTKKNWRMVPRKLQKTDNLCGFYTILSAFLLFKFYQRSLIIFMLCMF